MLQQVGLWPVLRYFKDQNDIKVIVVEPQDSAVLSGEVVGPHMIQGIGAYFVPGNINSGDYSQIVKVSNDEAFDITRKLAQVEGVLYGMSFGAKWQLP